MNTTLLAVALTILTAPPDGSLLFLENSNPAVKHHTKSSITHVAIVLYEDGEAWVYEAEPPEVKRKKFSEYIKEIKKLRRIRPRLKVWTADPFDWETVDLEAMKKYADSQLGRKYSIASWLRNRPSRGIHCGEYVLYVLEKGGLDTVSDRPWRASPGDIWNTFYLHCECRELVVEWKQR